MADISQIDMGEITRRYGEEKTVRMMKEIIGNNEKISKVQKQLGKLQVEEKKRRQTEIRRREEERTREQKEMNKWMEECRKRNEKEREEREEQRRVDKEWRRIKSMKKKKERGAEKEWKYQGIRERKREENRQKAMEKRKCFVYGRFSHMASHCRNMEIEKPIQVSSNRFEVLKVRMIQRGEGSGKEVTKDRKKILREEKAKRGVEVRQTKIEKKKRKEKMLREVVVKIGLKQEEKEEGIMTEALLDSKATGLVISEEFARRHKFKRMKLERSVYVKNIDGILNYAGPIVNTVEVEILFKRHEERTSIDVIGGQKWSIILGMSWLAYYNPEIDQKTGEVQMTRCMDECGKKWRTGRQIKPG